jgi:hypothetical protein
MTQMFNSVACTFAAKHSDKAAASLRIVLMPDILMMIPLLRPTWCRAGSMDGGECTIPIPAKHGTDSIGVPMGQQS